MIQVKMLKNRSALIEGDINMFLREIGTVPYTKVSLVDIKLDYHEKDDTYNALVVFNQTKMQQPPGGPPTKA